MQDSTQGLASQPLPPPITPDTQAQPPQPTNPTQTTAPSNSGGQGNKKKLIFSIIGLLVLVGGVAAGVLLVGQRQLFQQRASGAWQNNGDCTNGTCVINDLTCSVNGEQGDKFVVAYNCDTPGLPCNSNGAVKGPGNRSISAPSCGAAQIDIRCSAGNSILGFSAFDTGTSCSTGGGGGGGECSDYCAGQDQCSSQGGRTVGTACTFESCAPGTQPCLIDSGSGGGGGGGGTTATPAPKNCGESCSADSDCRSQGASGGPVGCRNGQCVNLNCTTQTVPGANCDCSTKNACGQPCGAAIGLCQTGSECGFIVKAGQCVGAEGNPNKQFCLPKGGGVGNGYSKGLCQGIQANFLIGPNGETGSPPLTQADVILACDRSVASPTPPPPPPPGIAAQCLNIQIFDTDWIAYSTQELAELKPGDVIRFTVAGSATQGVFDMARFTVNGQLRPPVTALRPGSDEFFDEYTIPDNTTQFTISAEIHHATLEWF